MIPVTLTIKGLYSYQQQTTIDFRPLTAAGLFGIFGAVGSGKSTILEAITFALYGETERLNSRDGRGYNMMNLKSNELLIDFEFTCGTPQEKYRFIVGTKRNKKRYLETTSFERKTYQWINGDWQPTSQTAAEILGLSYDNFKRTVIIPQGKFQEFLQLKETERVQMLKEIFNLEKYEIGPNVAILTKANDLKISHTEGQMQPLPTMDEATLPEKENAIAIHQKQLDGQTIELQKMLETEKAFETLKHLFADLQTKIIFWTRLKEKETIFLQLEKEVNEFENCEKDFKSLLESKRKIEKSLTEKMENFAKQKKESDSLETAIKNGELLVKNLEESYKTKDILLQKAGELEKIISIKKLKTSVEDFAKRIKKGQELINQKETESYDLKKAITALQEAVSEKEKSLPDTNVLVELSGWFSTMNQLAIDVAKELKESDETQSRPPKTLQLIAEKFKSFPAEMVFETIPETIETVQAKADQVIAANSNVLKTLKDELAHLQLSQKLEAFVQKIQPGEECPLCGSVHHPNILSVENVTGEIIVVKERIKLADGNNTAIQMGLIALSGLYADYASQGNLATQKAENLAKLKKELDLYKNSFLFSGYSVGDEQRVKNELKQFDDERKAINELRKQINANLADAEKLSKNITEYQFGIEKINREMAQSEGELKTLQSQVLLHDLQKELEKENEDLQNNIAQHKNDFAQITTRYEQAIVALQQNQTIHGIIRGKMEEVQNQLTNENADLENIVSSFQSLLKEHEYPDAAAVLEILDKKINLVEEKENIAHYQKEMYAANIQKGEAEKKVEGKKYDEHTHLAYSEEIIKLSATVKQQTELLATLKSDLLNIKAQLAERGRLQTELDKLIERSDNLKTLSNLFRSSGFVNYVSSVYLQNLVNAANQRFYKMTRQKLLLELTSENAFQVKDFFNNGEVRSVKTLSGGQTFQAALSLALALADNIQHLTRSSENFFFMDEGFGSLDKQSLNIVFETLRGLKKENRIVGIISHVEEMQQEIAVNLKILNDVEKGSLVNAGWYNDADQKKVQIQMPPFQ